MNRKLFYISLTTLLVLLLSVGGAAGQGPGPEERTEPLAADAQPQGAASIAATVNSRISYQGLLEEYGNPVTGSRDMTFRFYGDDACTTQVGSDIFKSGVQVTEGLFSVELDVAQDDFNGQGLWLQMEVGGTVYGCREILPAPYALSLRPGAKVIGNMYGPSIHAQNDQGCTGIYCLIAPPKGVFGYASATVGAALGVYGRSDSTSGTGVFGQASAASGITRGVSGRSDSSTDGAAGVYGQANAASGRTYGVAGRSDSISGYGVFGCAVATNGITYGVGGRSDSTSGRGVYGYASATSGETYGVYGQTDSSTAGTSGVYGNAGAAAAVTGVTGRASASSGNTFGVRGLTHSTSGTGVYGWASPSSGIRRGVSGTVIGIGYGLYTGNELYVGGSCTGCLVTFIARNTSGETLQVGDVLAASDVGPILQGHTTPVIQVRRATADDASVLGVVYLRGEFYAASDDSPEEDGDIVQPVEGDVAPGDYLLVVTSGLAQVRVAPASKGIAPGQSLTVGDIAGLATLSATDAKPDLVFGRAMEAQPDENGLLWAMIATQ